MKKAGLLATALLFALSLGTARATLVAYEGFDTGTGGYTAGALTGQTGGGHSGFAAGAWTGSNSGTVIETGLSYGLLETLPGAVQYAGGATRGNIRNLATAITPALGDVYWISNLVQFPTVPAADNNWSGLRWRSESGARGYWQGNAWGAAGDNPQFGLDRPNAKSGVEMAADTTYLLVQRIEVVQVEINEELVNVVHKWLWVNPDPTWLDEQQGIGWSPALNTAQVIESLHNNGGSPQIDPLALLFLENSTAWSNAIYDEVRLGTTWASVTPIPEPGTIGLLLGVGALALIRRRLRRKD